ncbi:MAG TPA: GNAT family N-acetyltransferase [Vicinamibacterales bacterium]
MSSAVEGIAIAQASLDSRDALDLIEALDDELLRRYPGARIEGLLPEDASDRLVFLIARVGNQPVACGAVREIDPAIGEIKRMFVHPDHRGRGIARAILAALEARAGALGYSMLRIETGSRQPEAIGLYTSAGYAAIPPFGKYVGNPYSHCFEKRLP